MRDDVKKIKKFLGENREFTLARIVNKQLQVKLPGSESIYCTKDFTLNSLIRRKLEELEIVLGLPRS